MRSADNDESVMPKRPHYAAFTLVELMVVIGGHVDSCFPIDFGVVENGVVHK